MKKFRLAKVLEWKETLEKEARTRRFAAEEHAESLRNGAALARSRRESIPDTLEIADKPAHVEGLRRLREKSHKRRRRLGERRAQETLDDAAARTKLPDPGSAFPADTAEAMPETSGENPVDRREPGSGSPSGGEGP